MELTSTERLNLEYKIKLYTNKIGPSFQDLGPCWIWIGNKDRDGYGDIVIKRKHIRVHRLTYTINVEKIPEGLHVLHKCDVRACCNPDHLFLGTNDINVKDMVQKNRQSKGKNNGRAKLTEEQVLNIREEYVPHDLDYGQAALARKHNVNIQTIGDIINGKNWKHL